MAWTLPRLLRRVRPALAHFQYAVPLRCPCPAVVTVHDLSFERDPHVMGRRDRFVFRTVVPRAVRRSSRVFAVSERTRRDLDGAVRNACRQDRRHAQRRRSGVHSRRPTRRLPPVRRRNPAAEEPASRGRRREGSSASGSWWRGLRKSLRSPASSSAEAQNSAAMSTSRRSRSCTAAPPASCCRRGTKGSDCRCSRRWRAARQSLPPTSRLCARSEATRPSTRTRAASPTQFDER